MFVPDSVPLSLDAMPWLAADATVGVSHRASPAHRTPHPPPSTALRHPPGRPGPVPQQRERLQGERIHRHLFRQRGVASPVRTRRDHSRYPWVDFDWPATPSPGDGRPSLDALLDGLGETVPARVRTVLRAGTAGLLLMADGPYLAWLSLTFLNRLPGGFLQPLPVRFGRFSYGTGFVARRSAEDLPPLRRLEAIEREIALRQRG